MEAVPQDEGNKIYNLYKCPECGTEFSEVSLLSEHCEEAHEINLTLENRTIKPRLATETEYTFVRAREYQAETTAAIAEKKAIKRIEERLGKAINADTIISIDPSTCPAEIGNQIIERLTEVEREKIIPGSIESLIKGDNIFFRCELVLPYSEKNLNAVNIFTSTIQQKKT